MADVRLADPRDAELVARLMCEFRDHLGYARPSDNAMLAGVEKVLEEPMSDFLLAGEDGVCQLRFRWGVWLSGWDCLLEDLYVAEHARGQGVGRALVEAAFARARERGARRMELDANEANAAAIALYESFGFRNRTEAYPGRDLYFRVHLEEPRA
jgi:ribosomal protein S18 acetylase RimI-like enzyme